MKRQIGVFIMIIAVPATSLQAVNVNVYTGFTPDVGGGAPYSNLAGSFTSPDVQFAANTGYSWHPFGLVAFGAEITGCVYAASDGDYQFALNSDDGSLLYIDGLLVVDNGGPHGPQTVNGNVVLTAGYHSFRVEFFEDYGEPSGVDLTLPDGVTYATCVPLDIKPTSCPNPLNVKSQGVLPAAILGTAGLDVQTIDVSTIKLAGVAPLRGSCEDVATPVADGVDDCPCTTDGPDGFDDLTLKFDMQEIVAALGPVADGDIIPVELTAMLLDGTPVVGSDCVIIRSKGNPK